MPNEKPDAIDELVEQGVVESRDAAIRQLKERFDTDPDQLRELDELLQEYERELSDLNERFNDELQERDLAKHLNFETGSSVPSILRQAVLGTVFPPGTFDVEAEASTERL